MHGVNNISKYSYFPHLSSESDEIRYTSSGHCGVNIYVFHIQRPMLGRIYYMSANGITLTHTVRRQDILEVKKKNLGKLSALRHGIPYMRSSIFL